MIALLRVLLIAALALVGGYLGLRYDGEVGAWLRNRCGVTLTVPRGTLVKNGWIYHRVRDGEVLSTIAQRYDCPLRDILAWNPSIIDPDRLKVGDVVLINEAAATEERGDDNELTWKVR